jgi:hypothetical protein
MHTKLALRVVIHLLIVTAAFAPVPALASAKNVLSMIDAAGFLPFDHRKIIEFRNALCEDVEQTHERAPPFTKEMQERLALLRAALPPLGTEGFVRGVSAMSDSNEVALETIANVVNTILGECSRTSNPDLRFWINVASALSDDTFDQVVTGLQQKGIDLRRPYGRTTALFVARQVLLHTILVRIVKPQINSSNP